MGFRLSKIYTRKGDKGETGLGDNTRIPKDHERIEAIGALDELNSAISLILSNKIPANIHDVLLTVQHHLFDVGGELSLPTYSAIKEEHTSQLEQTLDHLNKDLPPLKEFILPGGNKAASACHLARAICRRAERRLVRLSHQEKVNTAILCYLNRLSDLLFVIARVLARQNGGEEILWDHERIKK